MTSDPLPQRLSPRERVDRLPQDEGWPVQLAKDAYVNGEITLHELEEHLSERLEGDSFSPLPNTHVPERMRND